MTTRLLALVCALGSSALAQPSAPNPDPRRFEIGPGDEEAPPPARPDERIELSLQDGDLNDLVRMMTRITGRRFLISGAQRTVRASIAGSGPVTAAEAYRAFLTILHQSGLAVVRHGRHYAIVDSQDIARGPTQVFDDARPPPEDERFVTWLHHVEHVPVADAATLVDALRSSAGYVATHAATQCLILVDTGASIARLRRILLEIDVPRGDTHVWIERLRFAEASATAEQLRTVFDEASAVPTPAPARAASANTTSTAVASSPASALQRVIPDTRTNALILVATDRGYERALAILRELDVPDEAQTSVRVVRLQNGDAERVAATLTSLLGGGGQAAGAATQGAGQAIGLRGRVHVQAHADLNALVITASPTDFRAVRELIDALDVAPRQVYLEMVLMELSIDRDDEQGVNVLAPIMGIAGAGSLGIVGGGGLAELSAETLAGIALGVTVPSNGATVGTSTPTFGVLVHALTRSTAANVLSTPSVMVLDNHAASINIGASVPLQGSSVPGVPLFGASGTDATAQQMMSSFAQPAQRRDVGTIVEVTPHINDEGQVRLHVRAEDSRQGAVASGNLAAVSLNQSIAETDLVVPDGQTVVIGGLMREDHEQVRSGVPVLSEIPVLGALFGQTQRRAVRRNLLFFVTPFVVRDPSDLRAIVERRMRERHAFLDRYFVFQGRWEPPVDYSRTRGLVAEMLDELAELEASSAPLPPQSEPHVPRAPVGSGG